MDELRLIKKIQRNGDRAAADELVQCYYDEIYGFVRKVPVTTGSISPIG